MAKATLVFVKFMFIPVMLIATATEFAAARKPIIKNIRGISTASSKKASRSPEPVAKPWGMSGIPANFEFTTLPPDWAHLDPVFDVMAKRMPVLATAGIHTFFNGPESFTPDGNFILGEAPEQEGIFIGAGFNAFGIASGGGAGMA